jgi:acyl carrier protein
VAVTERDVELFAARIRPHFPPEQRDIAYQLAYDIARLAGPKVKLLRPDTTIDEIWSWMAKEEPFGAGSLDKVEAIMALEEELGLEVPDKLASRSDRATFRELVEHRAKRSKWRK